jgi:hypothetical protein
VQVSGCRDGCVIADVNDNDRKVLIEAAEWLGYALCHVEVTQSNQPKGEVSREIGMGNFGEKERASLYCALC